VCHVEDAVEVFFETGGLRAQLAHGYHVQRTFEEFGDALGRECFAGAGGAMEDGDETFALMKGLADV